MKLFSLSVRARKRAKHRYPARRGFSPACLYGFIKEVEDVRVACLSRTYFVYAQGEM